jgi:O-antigen ligase
MKLKLKFNRDKIISLAIMSSFFVLTFQYLILTYFSLIHTSIGARIQLTSKIIVGIFYLIALPFVLKRNKVFFFLSYLVSAFVFLLTYIIFPKNVPYIQSNLFSHFFIALPSLIYAFSINDFRELRKMMKNAGFGVFIIGTLISVLVFLGKSSVGSYSMSLSYYMLLPLLIYTDKFFNRINLIDLLIVVISLIIILGLGSRGALLCYLVFLFYRFVFIKEQLTSKKLLIYLIVFFGGLNFLLFYKQILRLIYDLLLSFNIRSRTLSLFIQSGIYLSGREDLYSIIIRQISENPFLGIGLFGDRIFIGGYSHNIFLEIWAHFGLLFGSVLIILLLTIIYQVLINEKNKKTANLMSIWFSIGFIHLLVSSTYVTDFRFFIFLGLSLNLIWSKHNNRIIYFENR